jgi:hypothetical protein
MKIAKIQSWSRFLLVAALLAVVPAARAQEQESEMTLDEEFAQLAEEIPGFGGLYLDAEGTTHVYLQDLSRAREVQSLGERVEVHQGEYDFRDLFAWKDEVRPQLAQRGAVFLDIDEQRNRLLFGVEGDALDAFSAELRSFLRGTRVPPEAVLVEPAEPIVPTEQLTDRIRPVPGGVQIQNENSGTCTLGVNAFRLGVEGFVTASHCTKTRSAVEGTLFYQNTVGPFNFVGTETADPPFFTGGSCPSGKKCRRSDAAFVEYFSATFSDAGSIANPIFCGTSSGTLLVDPALPRLPVTGFVFGSPKVGSLVAKVGRTTGCTCGPTKNTCLDVNAANSNITMLCQNRVTAGVLPGDSGSPVFWDDGDEASLLGILWGSSASGTIFVYSPWLFVHVELDGVMPDLP